MATKVRISELPLVRDINNTDVIVINENKVKADFSDPMWIPCFD